MTPHVSGIHVDILKYPELYIPLSLKDPGPVSMAFLYSENRRRDKNLQPTYNVPCNQGLDATYNYIYYRHYPDDFPVPIMHRTCVSGSS